MSDMQKSFRDLVKNTFDAKAAYQQRFNSLRSKSEGSLIKAAQKIIKEFGITGFHIFELRWPASFLYGVGTLPVSFINGLKKNGLQNADQVILNLLFDLGTLPKPLFRSTVDNHVRASPYSTKAIERHKDFEMCLKSLCIQEVYYHPFFSREFDYGAVIALYGSGDPAEFRDSIVKFSPRIEPLAQAFCEAYGSFQFLRRRMSFIAPAPVEVMRLMVDKDLSHKKIAEIKQVHAVTVYKQISDLKKALNVSTLAGAVGRSLKLGLVTLDDIY